MSRLSWVLSFFISLLLTGLIAIALLYAWLENQLPDVSQLKDIQLEAPLQVYTHDGKLIGEFGPVRRAPVTYEEIPPLFIKALLATEDQRFFEHSGIDIYGLVRAVTNLLLTGTKAQGGSTITMQVARNFYLTREKTYSRKFEEILLALKIDQELPKEKILELYLNKIFFGQQAYGIAAAAQVYYGKTLKQLTLAEMAMLAGLPQAPSNVNPITNPPAAKIRRDHVLERMVELNDITRAEYDAAVNSPLNASYHGRPVEVWAPYVGEMVHTLMAASFGDDAFTHSYKVYTTIDSQFQQYANQAIRNGLLTYDQRHGYRGAVTHLKNIARTSIPALENYLKLVPYANGLRPAIVLSVGNKSATALIKEGVSITLPWSGIAWTKAKAANSVLHAGDVIWVNQAEDNTWVLAQIPEAQAALVSLTPTTGAITSLVGGFDFRLSNFNRVTQALRQPGSGFKPFIYSAVLDKGYTLASTFSDAPLVLSDPSSPDGEWRPQDDISDQGKFGGPVRMREAMIYSLNLPAIRALQAIGIDYAINYLTRFGFDPKQIPRNFTIALGTPTLTPLQVASGYAVFANGGYRAVPYLIDKVVDANDKVAFQYQPPPLQRALSPQTAFLMVSALKSVIDDGGTGSRALSLGRSDLAGKTGTTNDLVDAWFNGFNSDVLTSVWVGFDQSKSVKEYGSRAALPIWMEFMHKALEGKPEHTLEQPQGIASANIDPDTGLLASSGQENAISEIFTTDTVPQTAAAEAGPAGNGISSDSGEPIF